MDITKYLEVIFEDQALLYAMLRASEYQLTYNDKIPADQFEQWQTDWLEETKRKLEEADESSDDAS